MTPRPFLSLPRKLRHHIYKEYFALHGGYVFQPGSGKLADADGQPLDLALMSTCSLIASETRELPFKYNSITFSTVYHPEWRPWAGRFDYLLDCQMKQRHCLAIYLGRFLTPEITSQIEAYFPWFLPVLEHAVGQFGADIGFSDLRDSHYWGISMSLMCCPISFHNDRPSNSALCRAVNFMLRLLAKDPEPELSKAIEDKLRELDVRGGLSALLDQHFGPWDIPRMSDLDDCGYRNHDGQIWQGLHDWHLGERAQYEYRVKYCFSATSVAIRFLKHLPLNKRLFIRNVAIREDRIAVGRPSSHALGLIPFCKENVRLKIDLQVGMLDNIFQRTYLVRHHSVSYLERYASHDLGEQAFETAIKGVFREVKDWLNEAVCLVDAGMPAGSFTLTFEGENAIDLCSDIFKRNVLEKLATQQALERVYPRRPGKLRLNWFGWKAPTVGIEHLVNQTLFLRSNFHPRIIPNVDKIVADRLDYDEEKWREDLTPPPWYDFSPSVHVPRLGALAIENFERRTCSRERKAQRRRHRRHGTYRGISWWWTVMAYR